MGKINRAVRHSAVAVACAVVCGSAWLPAMAAIVTSGQVSPDPIVSPVVGTIVVGNTGSGSLTVNAGSVVASQRLTLGNAVTGDGSVVVTGAGSSITTDYDVVGNFYNTNIGSQGRGNLSVLDGASFVNGLTDTNCQLRCVVKVSNGAGSDGTLLVSGAGSTLTTVGGVQVSWASVFTQAISGFDYGIPGGASQGRASVLAGGSVTSSRLDIGLKDLNSELTGNESSTGSVLVDGAGSIWNLVRNAAQTGGRSLIQLAARYGTNGSLEVRNGGTVRVDGSSAANQTSGMQLGSGEVGMDVTNGVSSLKVTGPGSKIEMVGGIGFINIGNGNGAQARADITQGGVVTGIDGPGGTGLPFAGVGRNGGTGVLNIDGTGSLLRLAGRNSNNDGGAFLSVGRFENNLAGNGTVNLSNGGRVEINTLGLVLTNPSSQSGMSVGQGAGSTGAFNLAGPGSALVISADSGVTPFVGIGRDGATGSMSISGGATVQITSSHVSIPNPGGYLQGDALFVDIGRRNSGNDGNASTGTLTITGAGSELVLAGSADTLIQAGIGANSSGSINLLNGGTLRSTALVLSRDSGSSAMLNMNAGHLVLDGQRNGGPATAVGQPAGAGVAMGRGDGTATAILANGSTLTINATAPNGGLALGGSDVAPGGTGTMLVSGGSTVVLNGVAGNSITVGNRASATAAGIGTLALSGAGSSVSNNSAGGAILIAREANTVGTVSVGAGATLNATQLIGIAHDGTANTGGIGVLVVNGTANAAELVIGSTGLLGGNGTINANITNHGTINPANSPGRITLNGAFDSHDGHIVLEVQSLGNGAFAVDEIVFGNLALVDIGHAAIEFSFLGETDPEAFAASGDFDLLIFFKVLNGQGQVEDLPAAGLNLFLDAAFTASAERYTINRFAFDPLLGVIDINATLVPLPASWLLVLGGLGVLVRLRYRGEVR